MVGTNFWESLRGLYLGLTNGDRYWEQERPLLERIVPAVENDISPRYVLLSPIGVGGGGIVVQINDTNLGVSQALKVARPVEDKYLLMAQIIAEEISHLRASSHPNIIDIFYHHHVSVDGNVWPYYIMEYIDGARDALVYLSNPDVTADQIVPVICQCAAGLAYLHGRGTVHLDVKLENILVSPDGRAVLGDLGSARKLSVETTKTQFTFTEPWAHPKLLLVAISTAHPESGRVRGEMPRYDLRKAFDCFALGRNIFRLLRLIDRAETKRMPPYIRAYLELMAARLLDGHNRNEECALGLQSDAIAELKYTCIDDVVLDLQKLTGEYAVHGAIPEIDHHYPRRLQISSNVSMAFPKRLAQLISHPILRRLAGISQLGMIVQIYPAATHSRLEHVLGTFANVARYCDALWNDPINPLFRQIMSERDITAVLLAALCHDLGQYPLAHDFEEADSQTFSHHALTVRILKGEVKGVGCPELSCIMKDKWGVEADKVLQILQADPKDDKQPLKQRLLHTLIDGPMDADKIDYLTRDSNNLNVPYGQAIDVERLLRCLTVVFEASGARTFIALGIHEKGKIPAEAIAFARYAMFGAVYWHHTSRSAKAMLHRAIWEAVPQGDRRSTEYRNFREDFEKEVLRSAGTTGDRGVLLEVVPEDIAVAPQMALSDYNMLRWLYDRTSANGKKLLEMVCNRDLFKRLTVVSRKGNPDLWTILCKFQNDHGGEGMLRLQRDLQKRLVELLQKLPTEERKATTLLSLDATNAIIGRDAGGEILFLVDLPPERPGGIAELCFLSETRTSAGAFLAAPLTETSIFSGDIAASFRDSVGKARVFCDSTIADTAILALPRDQVEGALKAACLYCGKPARPSSG